MTTNDDKKRWKDEANQLKKDLDNRKKIFQKREVPISFPKKKPLTQSTVDTRQFAGSNRTDDFFKQQINIDEIEPLENK
ncbi:MAG: hypothetical protein ACON35_05735 [Candidatus Marinamargulisbacteria bacterium]